MSDLISRADAVVAMRRLLGTLGDDAERELNCLTGYVPAEARPAGEWTQLYDNTWVCSNCEKAEQFGENIESTSDFCPNCGAYMIARRR